MDDHQWVREVVARDWGSPLVISPGGLRDVSSLPGFVAVSQNEPVGLVTYEMHQAAVVEFDESARVKLLKPPPDLVNLPERRRCGPPGKGRGKRAGAGGSRTARVTWRGRAARGVPARHLLVARCAVAARRIRTAAGITAT